MEVEKSLSLLAIKDPFLLLAYKITFNFCDLLNNMLRQVFLYVLLMVWGVSGGYAQSLIVDEEMKRWEGGAYAGLNNDGFEVDLRGLFFFNRYVGVKLGLGVAGELWTLEDWNRSQEWPGTQYGGIEHTYAMRFRVNPALAVRSPALFEWKDRDATFHLFAEPGIIFSPGSSGSRNARTLCWDAKAGVNMQMEKYVFTLGYGISDFSLYSGCPYSYWSQPGKKDYLTHTVFVGFGVKFRMGRRERKARVTSPYGFDGRLLPELPELWIGGK